MSEEIVIKLQGGMGNQMFQYALGRKLQEQLNAKLILDISDYHYDKAGRTFVLSYFCIPDTVIVDDSGQYNHLYDWRRNIIIKIGALCFPNLLFSIGNRVGRYIWEKTDYKELNTNDQFKQIMVHGYWHSERYFSEISEHLKKELQVKRDKCSAVLDTYNEMENENSVAVHIRRSDFLKKQNTNHVLHTSYYYNAMNCLEEKIMNLKYYFFSDDIQWVKEHFEIGDRNVEFIEAGYKDYEEFQLMTGCKHYIIANSTFSWWSSFVGEKPETVIIAPKCWYDDGRDVSALMRDKFTIIAE